jgi:hypothetical protein
VSDEVVPFLFSFGLRFGEHGFLDMGLIKRREEFLGELLHGRLSHKGMSRCMGRRREWLSGVHMNALPNMNILQMTI